jgi:hypothetical protein
LLRVGECFAGHGEDGPRRGVVCLYARWLRVCSSIQHVNK